jgi:hypothetical protein
MGMSGSRMQVEVQLIALSDLLLCSNRVFGLLDGIGRLFKVLCIIIKNL